jgi:hypothetical protein
MASFITVTHAKKLFKVTDKDLAGVPFIAKANPHYAGAHMMRLYNIRDVVHVAVHKRMRCLDVERHVAEEIVEGFDAKLDVSPGEFALPPDVLNLIMAKVALGFNGHDELRDVHVIIQELLIMSMVCKDFYHAAQFGMRELGKMLPSGNDVFAGSGQVDWDRFVKDPNGMKKEDCKCAARALQIKVGGTKPQIILRAFACLGMSVPRNVPASIVICMKGYCNLHIDRIRRLVNGLKLAGVRNVCTKNVNSTNLRFLAAQEYENMDALQEAYNLTVRKRRAIEVGLAALRK